MLNRIEQEAETQARLDEALFALGEIQSLMYSALNVDSPEIKTECIRKAFWIASRVTAKA